MTDAEFNALASAVEQRQGSAGERIMRMRIVLGEVAARLAAIREEMATLNGEPSEDEMCAIGDDWRAMQREIRQ